jgi:hypothetical protein
MSNKPNKFLLLFGLAILLISCSVKSLNTQTPTSPLEVSSTPQLDVKMDIGLANNQKTFTFGIASRFFIFLDDKLYPVNELSCTPEGIIGQISNGSLRGPGSYPVMFEGVTSGSCTLSDRDFQVEIVIK